MAPGSRVALVAFGLVAIAVGWFLVRPTVGPIRHDSPGTQESRSPPSARRPESSPPSSSDSRTETRTETRPAVAPAAPPLNAVPAGASPEVLRSYLSGRTPDETRPDGTQIFHNMPFEVRQPDGSSRIVPVTITLQPTAPKPVIDEAEPPKSGRKGN